MNALAYSIPFRPVSSLCAVKQGFYHIQITYMRDPKLPLCRATALPMNSAYPRTLRALKLPPLHGHSLAYEQGHFPHLKGAFLPFEGVYLRHLDWFSVNIILEAKSPSACRRQLGPALKERPGLQHSFEPSFESLRRKTRLLSHINHIFEGPPKLPLCRATALSINSAYPITSRAPKLPLCRATPLPKNSSAYPRTLLARKVPLCRATALPMNTGIFPI